MIFNVLILKIKKNYFNIFPSKFKKKKHPKLHLKQPIRGSRESLEISQKLCIRCHSKIFLIKNFVMTLTLAYLVKQVLIFS